MDYEKAIPIKMMNHFICYSTRKMLSAYHIPIDNLVIALFIIFFIIHFALLTLTFSGVLINWLRKDAFFINTEAIFFLAFPNFHQSFNLLLFNF